MYKGKVVIAVEINMNIPEDADELLPLEEIRQNIMGLDKVFQDILEKEILYPEDGITGQAKLEEAYIEQVPNEQEQGDSNEE